MLSIWPDPKFCPLGKSMDLNHSVSVTSISFTSVGLKMWPLEHTQSDPT